jgi:hypothetical protein
MTRLLMKKITVVFMRIKVKNSRHDILQLTKFLLQSLIFKHPIIDNNVSLVFFKLDLLDLLLYL